VRCFRKTLGVNDYYFASDEWEFPMGNIQMVGKSVPEMCRGEKPMTTRLAPHLSLEEVAEHAVDFWLSTEDLPRPENRVKAGSNGELTLAYKASNDGARDSTSVLNTDRRAHELDNLYAVDTSFSPSIAAVNPALTAIANAPRVGDHLLERLGADGG
jgi:GMC oxidoreductase